MKFVSLLVFAALLTACGSPLDEGYWKEHNVEAKPDENDSSTGEEVVYKMTLENLYDFQFDFTAESLKKLADGRISVSAEVNYPSNITLTKYTIESTPCTGFVSPPNYNPGPNAQTSTFSSTKELSAIAINPNIALENQYIMLYGTIGTGTLAIRMACSPITK